MLSLVMLGRPLVEFDLMGHPALQQPLLRMTVEEFLAWDDGTDTRYELIDGEVFSMAPPSPNHSLVAFNLGGEIRVRLKPPCRGFAEAGVRLENREHSFYQADLVVNCTDIYPGLSHVPDPMIIVEILSPSTNAHDRGNKLPDYRTIPSVREIVLVSSTAIKAEIWHRRGDEWQVVDVAGEGAVLRLPSLNIEIPLAEIFAGVVFETESEG
jgi:Uma2 family endonuclease